MKKYNFNAGPSMLPREVIEATALQCLDFNGSGLSLMDWEFSEAVRDTWSPTVRPPRLGGNVRKGVFATRSPFRPNPIGLSSVKLERIEIDSKLGPVLHVSGADLMDGTPIYDIKPYIVYTDSHPDAVSGFASKPTEYLLEVVFPEEHLRQVPETQRDSLIAVLAHDPRPQYQDDPERVYGMVFAGMEIKFKVNGMQLTVFAVTHNAGL